MSLALLTRSVNCKARSIDSRAVSLHIAFNSQIIIHSGQPLYISLIYDTIFTLFCKPIRPQLSSFRPAMSPRSLSRGRERMRSLTPRLEHSRSPPPLHRRSISPRRSRSPSYDRNGGRRATRSISRSPSPDVRSTKVQNLPLNRYLDAAIRCRVPRMKSFLT